MVKFSVRKYLTASIDVRMPTRAMMPVAMIITVRMVRRRCDLIDSMEILIFSRRNFVMMCRSGKIRNKMVSEGDIF
jgi:hypothetical protein